MIIIKKINSRLTRKNISCGPNSVSEIIRGADPQVSHSWGNACFPLTKYHWDVTESGIHPFLNRLACSRSQDAGAHPSVHRLPVCHTGAGRHQQTHSYSHSHLQASQSVQISKPACVWIVRTCQLYTGRSQLVPTQTTGWRWNKLVNQALMLWCSQPWATATELGSFQWSDPSETANTWIKDLFFKKNYKLR